jgi:hypothetical protein
MPVYLVAFDDETAHPWLTDMASGVASELRELDPGNKLVVQFFRGDVRKATPSTHPTRDRTVQANQQPDVDLLALEKVLEEGYVQLRSEAEFLRVESEAIHHAYGRTTSEDKKVLRNLQAISDGHISSVVGVARPLSVRETARAIMASPSKCQEIAFEDFEAIVNWEACQDSPLSLDAVRGRLMKRKALLDAALPDSTKQHSMAALRRIELVHLKKEYANSETMLGDRIEDIPKPNFFVSEDNYAWDMDELAQALTASEGVMRNPLTKQLFSSSDIRTILSHPLGQRLKPMMLKQDQLKKGIRPATIEHVRRLGRILLEDQTIDTAPSRQAMDEFQAYVITLPEGEQNTIDKLKINARDGFSSQAFDYTIGESVRDAVANTTCLHKVGDLA